MLRSNPLDLSTSYEHGGGVRYLCDAPTSCEKRFPEPCVVTPSKGEDTHNRLKTAACSHREAFEAARTRAMQLVGQHQGHPGSSGKSTLEKREIAGGK